MHNWKIISLTLLAKEYQFKCVFNTIRMICTSDYCMWLVLDQQECGKFGDLQCKTYTIGLQVSEKGICITCVLRTINSQHMIWKPLLGIHDGLKPDTIEQKISSISIFVAWAHWLNIFRVLKFLHWGPMTNISCCIYVRTLSQPDRLQSRRPVSKPVNQIPNSASAQWLRSWLTGAIRTSSAPKLGISKSWNFFFFAQKRKFLSPGSPFWVCGENAPAWEASPLLSSSTNQLLYRIETFCCQLRSWLTCFESS